jgi:hypothetical protein
VWGQPVGSHIKEKARDISGFLRSQSLCEVTAHSQFVGYRFRCMEDARDAKSPQAVQTGFKFLLSLQHNPVKIGSTKDSGKWRYKVTKTK